MSLTLGKSQVVRLPFPAARLVVGGSGPNSRAALLAPAADASRTPAGGPAAASQAMAQAQAQGQGQTEITDGVADTEITLLSPTELFFLGRRPGTMNVVLQATDGRCIVKDITVTIDPGALQAKLAELMPDEKGIQVRGADKSIVLAGSVTDLVKLDQVIAVAGSYGDPKKVVNLLRVTSPQQVMLEVKIAEVSKNLLDRLGSSLNVTRTASSGRTSYSLISDFLSNGGGLLEALRIGRGSISIDAQKNDGVVRVLAEPNIMAISGQPASFLSGGKIFIPVGAEPNANGFTRITLEEKEFGVGLKFTPTVLDGRVSLKVTSEVSELSQSGTPFTTVGGVTAILPSMTTRRVDTTVQLGDGQSFVVAGLIKSNMTESVNKIPGLGEAPVVGALFRSTEFQNDQTELMFVVTPRLVKPMQSAPMLPTDNHVPPSRSDVMLHGIGEGRPQSAPPAAPVAPAPAMPAAPR
jgi:pilus assembly protein CpaC